MPRTHGMAGFVLANGSMSSHQSGEGDIRRALIEADGRHDRAPRPALLQHADSRLPLVFVKIEGPRA